MSSPVRRMQIRAMKKSGIEKIVTSYEWNYDLEKMVPVYNWPRRVEGQLFPTKPDAKDLLARLARENRNKKRKDNA